MQHFIDQFTAVSSQADLNKLIADFKLSTAGLDQQEDEQTYKVVGAVIDGQRVQLVHGWIEPAKNSASKVERSTVSLEIDGEHHSTIGWDEKF